MAGVTTGVGVATVPQGTNPVGQVVPKIDGNCAQTPVLRFLHHGWPDGAGGIVGTCVGVPTVCTGVGTAAEQPTGFTHHDGRVGWLEA